MSVLFACRLLPHSLAMLLSVRQSGQGQQRSSKARPLARGERFAQEQKAEQSGDHKSHLRNRNRDARLPACHALAFCFMVEGMARGEASIAVPIAQMGFVITALLGFLFLREPFTARKGAGIAAALLALAALAHG